jgi:hypothetical protein
MKKNIIFLTFLFFANASDDFYYQNNKKVFLTPLEISQNFQKIDSNQTINYYKTQNNMTVGVSKEIIIKIKEKKVLKALLKKYPISLKTKLTSQLYVLESNSTSVTLEVSNQLYHDENVSYAHPNFIKKIVKR